MFYQRRFIGGGYVKVHQCQVDVVKPFFPAQQPAVNFYLRPVQRTLVVGHGVQVATKGFNFFKLIRGGVIAVSAAPHSQGFVVTLQGDFRLVLGIAPRHHHGVARHAFYGRW